MIGGAVGDRVGDRVLGGTVGVVVEGGEVVCGTFEGVLEGRAIGLAGLALGEGVVVSWGFAVGEVIGELDWSKVLLAN